MFGTYVEINLSGNADEALLNEWISLGFETMKRVEDSMSVYRPNSDISRLNRAKVGTWISIGEKTASILRASEGLSVRSDGAFDTRRNRCKKRSLQSVQVRGNQARRTASWTLDLGGIAKGFAVDCGVKVIQKASRGISGIINAGGDLRTWGPHRSRLGLRMEGNQGAHYRFRAGSSAIATSMIRTPAHNGRLTKAHFTKAASIDPSATVSVFARQCVWADALTKVVLYAPKAVATQCLAHHRARALVFNAQGQLSSVLP